MQASAVDCPMSYTNSIKQDEPNVGSLGVNIERSRFRLVKFKHSLECIRADNKTVLHYRSPAVEQV